MSESAEFFTLADGESWAVCHTRPRCEKKFAALMQAEQFAHYLPIVSSVRRYGRQTKRFTKPLFPGYVFARIPLHKRSRIYQQELVARVIPVEQEAHLLRQLEDVRLLIASGLEINPHPLVQRGTRVKVISGPLYGVEGVVDDPAHPNGIVVAVDVLQQGLLVRMPIEHLEPVV